MEIQRVGSRPSGKAPADYFTGAVRLDTLIESPDPARVRAVNVTFEPGARTTWHTHPLGQTLNRHIRLRMGAALGWASRGSSARRCHLVLAR